MGKAGGRRRLGSFTAPSTPTTSVWAFQLSLIVLHGLLERAPSPGSGTDRPRQEGSSSHQCCSWRWMGLSLWKRATGGGGEGTADGGGSGRKGRAWLAAAVWMLLVSSAGGAVLVWWALIFRPSNAQLWMVPVGLVVFGTPIVVWLSIFGSEIQQNLHASVLKAGGCSGLPVVAPAPSPAPGPSPLPAK